VHARASSLASLTRTAVHLIQPPTTLWPAKRDRIADSSHIQNRNAVSEPAPNH
jgi:hypothetical protein